MPSRPWALVVHGVVFALSCAENESCEATLSCAGDEDDERTDARSDGGDGAGVDEGGAVDEQAPGDTEPRPSEIQDSGSGGRPSLIDGGTAGATGAGRTLADASTDSAGSRDGAGEPGSGGFEIPITVTRCSADESACVGDTPVCDVDLDRCVVCLLEADTGCPAEAPYCVGTGNDVSECIECESLDDCGGATPVCSDEGACVACAIADDCAVFEETPLCREDGECVACLTETDCSAETPVCDEGGQCAGCGDSAECTRFVSTPVCNRESGGCVECTGNADCGSPDAPRCDANVCGDCQSAADCMGHPSLPQCDVEGGDCVACNVDSDCGSTTASACVGHECVPCTADEQCGHLSGTSVCDEAAGECVQCTGAEDDVCVVGEDQYVCDSLNRTCAAPSPENEVGSRVVCEPCVSDAHCAANQACAMTQLDGQDVGFFCQWVKSEGSCSLVDPYVQELVTETIDGASSTVCVLRRSTCPALLAYLADPPSCSSDDDCGLPAHDDAVCTSTNQCSIKCQNGNDCPNEAPCTTEGYCEL